MAYFRIKYECLHCGSCFIICTVYPERISIDAVICPECGAVGASIAHQELADGDVEDEVPGDTQFSAVGKNILIENLGGKDLRSFRLNPAYLAEVSGKEGDL